MKKLRLSGRTEGGEAIKRLLVCFVVPVVVLATAAATAFAAPSTHALTGPWVLDDGDGSTSYWIFGAGGADGIRRFTLFDTYATFCETAGPGTGSSLVAHGTAVTDGTNVTITVTSFNCANGAPGAAPAPLQITATLVDGGLDFGGGFVAARPGSG